MPAEVFFIDDTETERSAAQTHASLIDTQERMGALLDLLPVGLFIHQVQGALYANQQIARMLGHASTNLVGQHFLDFVDESARNPVAKAFSAAFNETEPRRIDEVLMSSADGTPFTAEVIIGSLPWDGTPVVQVLVHDVSELKEQARRLELLATTDSLTGAFNRRTFEQRGAEAFVAAQELEEPLSLVILDIDHFKRVNDTWGHHAGDVAIQTVVERAQRDLRLTDDIGRTADLLRTAEGEVSRLGGEEFVLLLPRTGPEGAFVVAERIRRAVAADAIDVDDVSFSITVSLGIATATEDDEDLASVLGRADAALYEAKENGRNRTRTAK